MRTVSARSTNRVPLNWPAKDSDEVLDYSIDFTDRLADCDYIVSASFSLTTAAGLMIDDSEHDGCRTATVTLSGGTEGEKAKVLCRITTAEGNTLDETAGLVVRAR